MLPSAAFALAALAPSMPPVATMPAAVADFRAGCAEAGRRLWGASLCAPVVIVNPRDGSFVASEPAPGPLPATRANTAFAWGGHTWIMVLAPLPAQRAAAAELLFHEAWHARQGALGLPASDAVAGHLGEWRARYLLRLEWNALRAALDGPVARRGGHVRAALGFRRLRLASYPLAAAAEAAQLRHEGLAAYTGAALSGAPRERALAALAGGGDRPALARSFAYVSGPAWGLILDGLRPGWRGMLTGGADLPDLVPLRAHPRPDARRYSGPAIERAERRAAAEREARLRAGLAATDPRRALRLPLGRMEMDFDPNQVTTAPDGSTLYGRITLRDRWGTITLSAPGLRIDADYRTAFAPWPLPPGALQAAPGWRIDVRPEGGADLVPPA